MSEVEILRRFSEYTINKVVQVVKLPTAEMIGITHFNETSDSQSEIWLFPQIWSELRIYGEICIDY